jgi:hypothetical protein
MNFRMETITPSLAAEMLNGNTRNRRLRRSLVLQYAKDMSAGRWLETHQGIAINCDGTILDGQHRLAAIVESGVTQRMLVARGVPASSQVAMDDHARRSCADALTLDKGEEVSPSVVAIAKAVNELSAGTKLLTRGETSEAIDSLSPSLEFVDEFLLPKQRGVTSAAVWSAVCLAWFYVADLQRLQEFCIVLSGREMPASDSDKAAVVLREWLLRSGAKGGGAWRREAFKKTQRAIVAFMERHDIGKLYGTTTHYPWPLVDQVR